MRESNLAPLASRALDYFRAPAGYFWHWVEQGRVIEWGNAWLEGDTICYREELNRVLRGLTAQGLPPLSSVLLLLAASADTWQANSGGWDVWHPMLGKMTAAPDDPDGSVLQRQMRHALQFMDVVRALPPYFRSGVPKLHLFREVFSAQAPQVTPDQSQPVLDEWASGRLDGQLFSEMEDATRRLFFNELTVLAQAFDRFPTTESLALRLRTGLDKLPAPLPEPLPGPAVPAVEEPARPQGPADLLDELAEDPRTAGVARLARHVAGALRVPMHTQGAGDQPLGGVADVTNRGSFDRLLISELVHDDLTLVARLVNQEALYLRREEPPRPAARPRAVLLDTTLRLWGTPRVFALAAALAWARQGTSPRHGGPVAAYALGGQAVTPLDLASYEGVVAALGHLDPALHCGGALATFGEGPGATTGPDGLLVTAAELLTQPAFGQALAAAGPWLRFVLAVDRDGTLALYELANGHRALRSSTRYDLDALLFAKTKDPALPFAPGEHPAFMRCIPAPLYLPMMALQVSAKNTFQTPARGVLCITDARSVLYWENKDRGARELLPVIEAGDYCFGIHEGVIYVLVSGPHQRLIFHALPLDARGPERLDLSKETRGNPAPPVVVYAQGCFYLQFARGVTVFDCLKLCVVARGNTAVPAPTGASLNVPHVKRIVNNGYSVLQRVASLGVNTLGELVLGSQVLRLVSNAGTLTHELRLLSKGADGRLRAAAQASHGTFAPTPNPQVRCRRFQWPDGSEAVMDPRGLLHLRSADAAVPEITLVTVLNHPAAAWAADGTVCGPDYFTGPNPARRLAGPEFYRQYLQRFIARLG